MIDEQARSIRVFPGRYKSLSLIRDFVVGEAKKAGLDESGVYAIELAVDEACCNIIDHAYGGENIGEIECCTSVEQEGLEVTLTDHGKPFDPGKVKQPDFSKKIDEMRPRGVGFYLMKKMVDVVDYHREANAHNVMRLFKKK